MTREEAAGRLKKVLIDSHNGYQTYLEHGGKQDIEEEKYIETLEVALEALKEPPRKRGIWIHDGQRITGGVDWWHCSECLSPESGVYAKMPYCAKCGAYMGDESE